MRVKLPILNNPVYCKILYFINTRKITASELAKELKKKQPVMFRQLKELEDKKFLTSEREDLLNKKLYFISYLKIIEEFVAFLKRRSDRIWSEAKRLFGEKGEKYRYYLVHIFGENLTYFELLKDKKFLSDIENNQYLTSFFQKSFNFLFLQKTAYTIQDLFNLLLDRGRFNEISRELDLYLHHKYFPKDLFPEKYLNLPKSERKKIQEYHEYSEKLLKRQYEQIEEEEKRIFEKDKDFSDLIKLSKLIKNCSLEIDLDRTIVEATEEIKEQIIDNNIDKDTIIKYLELQIRFFVSNPEYKTYLEKRINKLKENKK